jgi:hypothetical protein
MKSNPFYKKKNLSLPFLLLTSPLAQILGSNPAVTEQVVLGPQS